MANHDDVNDECAQAVISSSDDIDEWGIIDYGTSVGVEYNEMKGEPITRE